jgi:hypothetical protein
MPDKKLTNKEIVKDLKEILELMLCEGDLQRSATISNALDLINHLQEDKNDLEKLVGLRNKRKYYRKFVDEVYRKEKGNELSDPDFDYIYELYFKLQAENKRLKNAYKQCAFERDAYIEIENTAIAEAKAEAYKECIEKVKMEAENATCVYEPDRPQADNMVYHISNIRLNNLLKELVGDGK